MLYKISVSIVRTKNQMALINVLEKWYHLLESVVYNSIDTALYKNCGYYYVLSYF